MKTKLLKILSLRATLLATLVLGAINGAWAEGTTATITFGSASGSTSVNATSVTGDDSQENRWTITTTGTNSFTANAAYSQIGSSSSPANSITFTTTLSSTQKITAFSAKFGGFSGTSGTVTMNVGETTVGSGSIKASTDVIVSSTKAAEGTVLTLTVTDISKGVKAYYISYTYEAPSDPNKENVTLAFSQSTYTATLGSSFSAPKASATPSVLGIKYHSDDTNIATVDETTGDVTLIAVGTVHITASFAGDDDHNAADNVSYTLTVLPAPFIVTLSDDSSTITETANGDGVNLPTRSDIGDYTFAGWCTTNVSSETTVAPTIINASETYYPTANIILYPVYTRTESGVSYDTNNIFNSGSFANNVITWSIDDVVSIKQEKNSGGTAPNSSYVSAPRWYTGNKITITPIVTINSITVTAISEGYATALSGSTYTNASASVNNSVVTITPTNGNSNIIIVMGGQSRLSSLTVNYGGATTYYWSSPVAAVVKRPTINLAENPFLFSTTATITCETDGATIYYSYDNSSWTEYTEALTINETKTIYAKAVLDAEESSVANVTATKNLATPTVAVSGDLTADLAGETNVSAGTLTAVVTYNAAPVAGATVTWTSSDTNIAEIDGTGAVTIKAMGTVTFTATYAENSDYAEATGTKTITVIDSKEPGTVGCPYTVTEALAAEPASGKYVTGTITDNPEVNLTYHNATYTISDGTNEMIIYRGKYLNNANFTSEDQIEEGDVVVVYGELSKYNEVNQMAQGNYLISLVRKQPAPISFAQTEFTVLPDADFTAPTLTNEQGLTVTYSADDNGELVILDDETGEVLIGENVGEVTITATFAGDATYKETSVSYTITIAKGEAELSFDETSFVVAQEADFTGPTLSNPHNLTITYSTSDEDIAYVDENTGDILIGTKTGTATITATAAATIQYNSGTATYTIEVTEKTISTVTFSINGDDSQNQDLAEDTEIIFPAVDNIGGLTFQGWIKEGDELTESNVVTAANMGASDVTYLAVFAKRQVSSTPATKSYGFEDEEADASMWTITGPVKAGTYHNSGSYAGKINSNNTYVTFNEKVKVTGFSFAFTRTSSNSNYYVCIETSTDNSTWTAVETYPMNTFESDGTFATKSHTFDGNTALYVRFYCYNTTAVRYVDDVTITYNDEVITYTNLTTSIPDVNVTITSDSYATFADDYARDFTGTGVNAYIAETKGDGTGVNFTQVSKVPAGTGVLLYKDGGTGETPIAIPALVGDEVSSTTGNVFVRGEGTGVAYEDGDYYNYILSKDAQGKNIGFYRAAGRNVATNKAYISILKSENTSGVKFFALPGFDDETAINEIVNGQSINGKWYNLAGQRVNKAQKGIFIVNGKKVVK